jgi:hypothetical protein
MFNAGPDAGVLGFRLDSGVERTVRLRGGPLRGASLFE